MNRPETPTPNGDRPIHLPLPLEWFDTLFEPLHGRRVFYHQPPGNVGDALIHAGAFQLFDAHGIPLVSLEEADAIVFGGGGNWGLYPEARRSRDAVLAAKAGEDVPLVVFPQSIHSLEEPVPVRTTRFHVREAASLLQVPGAILAPDTAMAFRTPEPGAAPLFDRGVLLRNDTEGLFAGHPSLGDPIRMVGTNPVEYVRAASSYARIFTDRLHFAIAGLLAGREVTLLPNSYHKNRSMWETWLRRAGCRWADSPPPSRTFVDLATVPVAESTGRIDRDDRTRARRDEPFPTIAITMCLHNEGRFLEENLRYHEALGVGRAYLFLDECTDRTEEIIAGFPWAVPIQRPCPRDIGVLHIWQNACADEALRRARDEGFEWLLHIDPDEFAFAGNPLPESLGHLRNSPKRSLADQLLGPREHRVQYKGHLGRMLAGIPPEIVQVVLRPKESVPVLLDGSGEFDFWKNPFFQDKQPLRREILDPSNGEVRELDAFLGHVLGKALIRTSASVQALNPHRWTVDQKVTAPRLPLYFPLPTVRRGWHYHYLIVSPGHWLKKFRRESRLALTWEDGRDVEFPKRAWRIAGATMELDEAVRYLKEWVFLDPERAEDLVQAGKMVKEDHVIRMLREVCGHGPSGLRMRPRSDSMAMAVP